MINIGHCCNCKCEVWLPDALYEAAQASPDVWFYCAYGHHQHYPKTPMERREDKLRRERDRLAQRVAEQQDMIRSKQEQVEATERQLSAAKGRVTRIKNRVSHGVCPCCNRTFANLAAHMKTQHADYSEKEIA